MEKYEISYTPIVASVQVYDTEKGQSKEGKTRYECSMLITNLSCGECRLHFVQGALTNEINLQMMNLCRELGYRQVQFEVPAGTSASRHAKFMFTHEGLDRYIALL